MMPPGLDDEDVSLAVGGGPRVRIEGPAELREAALWALEALFARARVANWHVVDAGEADITWGPEGGDLRCDIGCWQFGGDVAPAAELDPLAFTFWWLARVEELLAPPEAFDEHGRFRFDASAMSRLPVPLLAPVDALAQQLAQSGPFRPWVSERDADAPAWQLVATHDVDLPWRWTRAGKRRALRGLRADLRRQRAGSALRTMAALVAHPVWRLRGSDPWSNAWRIERLERREGARATSYLMADRHRPEDGEPELVEHGAEYAAQLAMYDMLGDLEGGARAALHGSYASSSDDGRLAAERDALERRIGRAVRDHRFHYLRHHPVDAWPLLERAGLATDASLGFAEQPGFRAGTAHPFRAWDHAGGMPLDLIVVPLACMDASFDARYLGVRGRGERARRVREVVDAIRHHEGAASLLVHNDRLCNLADDGWTRLYRATLRHVAASGGVVCTAAEAAATYRAKLPPHRRAQLPPARS